MKKPLANGEFAEYQPDLVLHGHAHAGSFKGRIGDTPVYNVAVETPPA